MHSQVIFCFIIFSATHKKRAISIQNIFALTFRVFALQHFLIYYYEWTVWLMTRLIVIFTLDASRPSILLFTCVGCFHVCGSSFLHSKWRASDYKSIFIQEGPELFTDSFALLTSVAHKIWLTSLSQCWFKSGTELKALRALMNPSIWWHSSQKIPLSLVIHVLVSLIHDVQFLYIPYFLHFSPSDSVFVLWP